MKRLLVLTLLAACSGQHRDARDTYNQGVEALSAKDFEKAEKLLLDARSAAGVDPELRFRAAYDLGVAYAAHADKVKEGKDADLAKALELAQQAVSWLSDAARLRKDDPDTVANLAIVRARVQAISDELRKAEGKLEARLDALIGEQRGVLEDARGAWLAIKQAGGTDPLAQQGTLTHLADRERGIVAEAGVINDLASDEIDTIGKKADDKRTDQEKVRVVQLKNLDLYLLEGRDRIGEARRKLQELAAEEGVHRAEAALVALKRAREQLLDPITVLRGIAQDQVQLLQDTTRAGTGDGIFDPKTGATPPDLLPAWLAPTAMSEREGGLHDRLEEVRARLAAATEPHPDAKAPEDPKQAKLLERVKAALPFVVTASGAMDHARQDLGDNQPKKATDDETAALLALAQAIEQFADLKQTIELAYADQQQIVALVSPADASHPLPPGVDRGKETREALARNVGRVTRLKELIADEVAGLKEPPVDPKADPKQAEAAKQQLEQQKQMFARAEELRGQAQTALDQLDKAIVANKDPLTPAKDASGKLEELRKLFFSVIEHLQQLIRDQGETRDQTSVANADDPLTRDPKLPNLVTREEGHDQMAKAITDALAAQADAAGKQPQPQPGAPDAKALSAAADEVRQADGDIGDTHTALVKARDAKNQTVSLNPAIKSEGQAIEHLQRALELLQPPKQQKQDQDKQDQKQQQAQQDKDKKQDEQPKAGGASQRARDEDAKRQKDRRKQESGADPVDKDW